MSSVSICCISRKMGTTIMGELFGEYTDRSLQYLMLKCYKLYFETISALLSEIIKDEYCNINGQS